jgi:hypothetical protein
VLHRRNRCGAGLAVVDERAAPVLDRLQTAPAGWPSIILRSMRRARSARSLWRADLPADALGRLRSAPRPPPTTRLSFGVSPLEHALIEARGRAARRRLTGDGSCPPLSGLTSRARGSLLFSRLGRHRGNTDRPHCESAGRGVGMTRMARITRGAVAARREQRFSSFCECTGGHRDGTDHIRRAGARVELHQRRSRNGIRAVAERKCGVQTHVFLLPWWIGWVLSGSCATGG